MTGQFFRDIITESTKCGIVIKAKGSDSVEQAGEIIRRMLKQKGVSVNELANRTGKAQNTVSAALSRDNITFKSFVEYVEALGYSLVFHDEEGEKLVAKKERVAPPTIITIGKFKYNNMTAEPLVCAEQTDGLFAELYRKTLHEYFIVYFEKGGRATLNPVTEQAARSFWRQYKSPEDKDEIFD